MEKLRTIKVIGTIVLAVLAIYMVFFDYTLKGFETPYDYIQNCEIEVNGNQVKIRGEFINQDWRVQDVKYTENDGVVYVEVVQASLLPYDKHWFDEELIITRNGKAVTDEITQVWIGNKIAWDSGVNIRLETAKLFYENFSSVKDETDFARLIITVGVNDLIGEYEYSFDEETPGELVIKSDRQFSSDVQADVEARLKQYACVLIGAAAPVEKVTYEYYIDGQIITLAVTETEADTLAGNSVKEQFKYPKQLQEMLYSIGYLEAKEKVKWNHG